MAARLRQYEPRTLTLKVGPVEELEILVRRLSVEESNRFDRAYWRAVVTEADRLALVRITDEEQATTARSAISTDRLAELRLAAAGAPDDAGRAFILERLFDEITPTDHLVISDDEIRRRRILDFTAEQLARYEQLRLEDQKALAVFLNESLELAIKVRPGQLEWEDEAGAVTDVTTGAQLAACFGASRPVLQAIVREIRAVNELSTDQKNDSGSRSTSRPSSIDGRDQTVIGESSGPTAVSVDSSASAGSAAATPIEASSSGPTE